MLFWILLLALGIVLFAFFTIGVFPKMFLKNKYRITKPLDRGLKKYRFSDTEYAVLYEPSLEARNFITQYILAKKDGKKFIKCKIAPNIAYIDFDIILFDSHGKSFLVMSSMDVIGNDRLTQETELPKETAFVSVLVNQVNDTVIRQEKNVQTKVSSIMMFGLATLASSMVLAICFVFSFSRIFGGLFKESFANKMMSSGWTFIVPGAISSTCVVIACMLLTLKNKKR